MYFLPALNASGLILLGTASKDRLCSYMAKPNQERPRTKLRKLLLSPFRNDYWRPAEIWGSKKKKRFSCQMKIFKVSLASKSSMSDKHKILLHLPYLLWYFEHTFQKISLDQSCLCIPLGIGVAASKQRTQLGAGLLLETSQQNSTGVLQIWFWCRGIVVKSTTEETCIGDSPFPSPAPSHVMLVTAEMRRHKSN